MMVIFLVGLVSMILMRTLRKDYARYSREEDLDDMVSIYLFMHYLCLSEGRAIVFSRVCLSMDKMSQEPLDGFGWKFQDYLAS